MKQIYIMLGLLISITLFSCGGDNSLNDKKYRLKTLQLESDESEPTNKSTYKLDYDSEGNLHSLSINQISYIQSTDNNGNISSGYEDRLSDLYIYTYNKDGNLLSKKWYSDYLFGYIDASSQGSTASYYYTYDSNGNMLTISYSDNDYASTTSYTYDSKGNKLTESFHLDRAYYYYFSPYDETDGDSLNANIINTRYDITTYSYDSKGNISEEKFVSYDQSRNYTRTYTYDSNSKLLTDHYHSDTLADSYDKDADGVVDTIRTYTYDTNGKILTDSYDKGTDGIMDAIRTFTYDSEGKIKIETFDKNADGIVNYKRTYTYERAKMVKEISPIIWKSEIEGY